MKILTRTKKIVTSHWQEMLLGFFVLLFFMGTSSFLVSTQNYSSDLNVQPDFVKWGSPDETANYIFAKLYSQEGRISLKEDYNLLVDDIMRPRSFRSDFGDMKPVSFLGIILIYGSIASFFGYEIIPFLTPFFASIGIIFFYLLIREIFGRSNAFLSSMLLVFFPPFVYYTARSMFHNVLFTVLLVISLYFAVLMTKDDNFNRTLKNWLQFKYLKFYIFASLSGLFFGLTIITRVSELLWLAPAGLVLWLFNIKRIGVIKLLLFLLFLFLASVPMFYYNQILYGSFFSGGYPQMNASIQTLAQSSTDIVSSSVGGSWSLIKSKIYTIRDTIFHFGFDWEQSKKMFQGYFIDMFHYIFLGAMIGLGLFFISFKKNKYKQWVYLLVYILVSYILVVYYGSWVFHDNPDIEAITIGNSYTRYWLPVYLGALPFLSLFLIRLSKLFCLLMRGKIRDSNANDDNSESGEQLEMFSDRNGLVFCGHFLAFLVVLVLAVTSVKFVLVGSEEGLIYAMQKTEHTKTEWQEVLQLTESNSAIVTMYHDKLFFPERKVIVGLFDDPKFKFLYSSPKLLNSPINPSKFLWG